MVDYQFSVSNGSACGILQSGEHFWIDADLVIEVSKWSWRKDKDGYLCRSMFGSSPIKLHRWIVDAKPNQIVDHANHNRLDCRRSNLRIVTAQQNSMNHSPLSNNKTGFTGVFFDNTKQVYVAKVGYNGKRIYLGSSDGDLVKLAQMYNIAASFLFGEFVGVLNDVATAPQSLQKEIITKCSKYIAA